MACVNCQGCFCKLSFFQEKITFKSRRRWSDLWLRWWSTHLKPCNSSKFNAINCWFSHIFLKTVSRFYQQVFVSAVISQYMELKCRRKTAITTDKFTWAFSPTTGDFFISARLRHKEEDQETEEREDFYSVASSLSPCSNATSFEAFVTAKTVFSRSSSLESIDFQDLRRHSVIQELSDCEGWPFGLYRKALLLPPLPKSPSDSWSWRESARMVKMHW